MKKLLALFVLIVAASAAAPGLLATRTQERYDAAVAQLEASGYRIVDSTYARGWFTADARLQLEIPVPEGRVAGAEPPRVLVKTHAVHGPFLGDLERPFGLARLDSEIWLGSAPLVVGSGEAPVRTLVGFLGGVQTLVDVPARQLALEGGALEMAAVTGAFDFGSGARVAVGELSMPSLRFDASDGAAAELRDLRFELDLRRGPGGLPVGSWRLGLESMAITPVARGEGKPFALRAFTVTGTSEERDGAMDATADYRVGSILAEGETYGPFDLRLSARRLAVDALLRIQAAGDEAVAAGATAEERAQALGVALLANADALLAKDPAIALDQLSLDVPQGRVAAAFELRTQGLRAADLRNLPAALQRLQGKATLRMPEVVLDALLRQQGRQQLIARAEKDGEATPSAEQADKAGRDYAAQQIETLVAQQLLARDGGAVTFAAELRNGLLTVNGKSIPIAALLPRPGAQAH